VTCGGCVCPLCNVRYLVVDFVECLRRCRWSVAGHFLVMCKSCRNLLLLRYAYLDKGARIAVEIVLAVKLEPNKPATGAIMVVGAEAFLSESTTASGVIY